jgi:sigma-B regulation protein RsbU (phosphoserine phosphatase)
MSKKELSDEDLLFIDYLGNTAIAALENERLFQEELKKKQLESELNLALEIQKGLFPSEAIEIENYSIYGRSIPSKQVGGDYYDHIQIDENRYFILIADVSGKGMPAAMIMANLQAALRVLVKLGLPLLDIIINLNHIVYSNTSQDKFVTFFGGILDTKKNTFEYINAGHNPPYLFRDGKVINLDKGGLFLGLMDGGFPYESEEIKLEDNDFIILYTDGITEAMNTKNEEFGDDNLIDICQKNTSRLELLDDIIEKVKLFSYGSSQYDDITMLALVIK